MANPRQATVRSIAALAEVSCSTVTRALRNDLNVLEATRSKVMAAARELGYRRNPLASNVMSHIRRGRASSYRGKIAWINSSVHHMEWTDRPWRRPLLEGAKQRAGQLGYDMEEVWLADPRLSPDKLTRMLQARGIQGLLIPEDHAYLTYLDWCRFAAVTRVKSGCGRQFDRVGTDDKRGVERVFEELRRRGYRRVGLMQHDTVDRDWEGDARAAYLLATDDLPVRARVPVLLLSDDHSSEDRSRAHADAFANWVTRCRPEVVICVDEHVLDWTQAMNLAVPDELGLVHLDHHAYLTQWAGIDQRADQIGAAMVDVVVAQLIRGELGIPAVPKDVLIRGCWVDGATLRPPSPIPRPILHRTPGIG